MQINPNIRWSSTLMVGLCAFLIDPPHLDNLTLASKREKMMPTKNVTICVTIPH